MIRILIFISALLFFIPFANAEDIFNGTILFKNNDWVSVLAEVNEQQNGNLILKIEKIDEVHLDETCHLLEALKNFENRE